MEPGSLLKSAARQQEVMVINPNWGVSSQKQLRESSNMIIKHDEVTSGGWSLSVECLKAQLYKVEIHPVQMQHLTCCEQEAGGETSWASSSLDEAVSGILSR